ncbi:MAG: 6-pyruvoyl-tetrahydropterin synthase-related protein, partial [Anaerolineae bacterium]
MPTTLPALAPFAPPPGPLREGGRVLRRPAPRRRWIVWLLALLVSLPACLPLLQPGFFVSDDGLFHLYRVAALGDAIGQGLLYPRWFAEFGFGYGQPVLHFYSPLSYYLAVPFLPFGALTATKIVFALGFILPALAMFAFARRWWDDAGGLLAAAVYTYSPYHLADGLLRGALAEHLAFVWPPLIFLTLLPGAAAARTPRGEAWRWTCHALAWAGLILTHHLTALMLAPIWVGAVICLGGTSAPGRRILSAATAFSAALGLTAFYWLPVIAEAGAVKLGADPLSTGYRQHLLPLLVGRSLTYVYRLAADQPWQHVLGLCMALLLLLTVASASGRALLRLLRAGRMNSGRRGVPSPEFSPRVALFIFAVIAC